MSQLLDQLAGELADLPAPCSSCAEAVTARVADILRPPGALARLDELAVWLAGWQRRTEPTVGKPAALIFAGDHGVCADGVSAYPSEVTAAMLAAFNQDRASVSAMARVAGASVTAVDVGVGRPTANIRIAPAMDADRFAACFQTGRDEVAKLDTDLLIVGEMGIGNTTAAAAIAAMLLSRPAGEMVGAGTGVAGEALDNKTAVAGKAIERTRADGITKDQPMEVLRHLGGTELVAMAGALFEARQRSVAVLLDGYITSAAALVLHRIDGALTEHTRAGHGSAEPGHRLVLDALGLTPLLNLDFRLGEASGAMAALPLVKMACELVTAVPTFAEWAAAAPAAADAAAAPGEPLA